MLALGYAGPRECATISSGIRSPSRSTYSRSATLPLASAEPSAQTSARHRARRARARLRSPSRVPNHQLRHPLAIALDVLALGYAGPRESATISSGSRFWPLVLGSGGPPAVDSFYHGQQGPFFFCEQTEKKVPTGYAIFFFSLRMKRAKKKDRSGPAGEGQAPVKIGVDPAPGHRPPLAWPWLNESPGCGPPGLCV